MVYTDFTSLNSTIDPDASAWVVMSSQPLKRTETIATYNSEKQLDKLTTSEDVKYRADIMNVISEETITHTFPSNTPVSKDDIIFAIFHKHGEEVIVEKYYNVRSKKLSVEYDGVFNDETLRNLSSLETSCFQSRIPLLGLIYCFNSPNKDKYLYFKKLYKQVSVLTALRPFTTAIAFALLYFSSNMYLSTALYIMLLWVYIYLINHKALPVLSEQIYSFSNNVNEFDKKVEELIKTHTNNSEIINKANSIVSRNNMTIDTVNINNAAFQNTNMNKAQIKEATVDSMSVESATVKKAEIEKIQIEDAAIDSMNAESANIKIAEIEKTQIEDATIDNMNAESANIKIAEISKIWVNEVTVSSKEDEVTTSTKALVPNKPLIKNRVSKDKLCKIRELLFAGKSLDPTETVTNFSDLWVNNGSNQFTDSAKKDLYNHIVHLRENETMNISRAPYKLIDHPEKYINK